MSVTVFSVCFILAPKGLFFKKNSALSCHRLLASKMRELAGESRPCNNFMKSFEERNQFSSLLPRTAEILNLIGKMSHKCGG